MTAPAALLRAEGGSVIVRRDRRARRLSLKVDMATGQPVLTAPRHLPQAEIARFLAAQDAWLSAQLAQLPARRRLEPGQHFPFRGQERRIEHDPRHARIPQLAGQCIRLGGPADLVEARLLRWLKDQARATLSARASNHAAALEVDVSRISVRDTRSRWGSCSTAGGLNFSWRLILAPEAVLDYVTAHEVAHRREMNHSPRFWALVERLVGDYRAPRSWLRRHGSSLFFIGPPAA